jgi:bifunctional protein folD
MTLLSAYDIDVKGKKVAILGRSNIVGKPMALMMINAGATVLSCNSHTPNLAEITRMADIIIVAIGKPKFLTREMVREGAIIVDVGSNMDENGKFCGDADFDNLKNFVQAISPSPGGVGPMTVATLIENTWKAYKNQHNLH